MTRRNHRRHGRQRRHYEDPLLIPRAVRPAVPLRAQALVLPVGRYCGKLAFTKDDAPKALQQAREKRMAEGSKNIEKRHYECPRCGWHHLTSRAEWKPEPGHAQG